MPGLTPLRRTGGVLCLFLGATLGGLPAIVEGFNYLQYAAALTPYLQQAGYSDVDSFLDAVAPDAKDTILQLQSIYNDVNQSSLLMKLGEGSCSVTQTLLTLGDAVGNAADDLGLGDTTLFNAVESFLTSQANDTATAANIVLDNDEYTAITTYNEQKTMAFLQTHSLDNIFDVAGYAVRTGVVTLELKDGVSLMDAYNSIASLAGGGYCLEFVEFDIILSGQQTDVWATAADVELIDTCANTKNLQWSTLMIDAPVAWDLTGITTLTPENEIIVLVADTGIDYNSPAFEGRLWTNDAECNGETGVDDDGNGYIDDCNGINMHVGRGDAFDDNGHGTHVAGIIAANLQEADGNFMGVTRPALVGVAPNAKIMPCKFLRADRLGYTSNAVKCMEYGFQMGASFSHHSWGAKGGAVQSLALAMSEATLRNELVITSAGNDQLDNDNPATSERNYPSSYADNTIIAVSALTENEMLRFDSCWGATNVDLAAPGDNIFSVWPGDSAGQLSFHADGGTSMAAPHVSGAAAVLLGACKLQGRECTADEIKAALVNSVRPVEALSKDLAANGGQPKVASEGVLNVAKAVENLGVAAAGKSLSQYKTCTSGALGLRAAALLLLAPLLLALLFGV